MSAAEAARTIPGGEGAILALAYFAAGLRSEDLPGLESEFRYLAAPVLGPSRIAQVEAAVDAIENVGSDGLIALLATDKAGAA